MKMTNKPVVNKDATASSQIASPKDTALPISTTESPKDSSSLPSKNNIGPKNPSTSISRSRSSTMISAPQQISLKEINQSQPEWSSDPIHSITWDGLDEECEPLGQSCCLCDKDFTYPPEDDDDDDQSILHEDEFEDDGELELSKLPSVDILPCGHAFHTECLKLTTSEEQCKDPQCILCLIMD